MVVVAFSEQHFDVQRFADLLNHLKILALIFEVVIDSKEDQKTTISRCFAIIKTYYFDYFRKIYYRKFC